MNSRTTSAAVPQDIAERFLPQEAPVFEVVRETGRVRLWRSVTQNHAIHGTARTGQIRYHVTVGEMADLLMMPRFQQALDNFEAVAAEAEEAKS